MNNSIISGIIMGQLTEINRHVSNIWAFESMVNPNHKLFNNLYLDNLFNLNKYSLILDNSLIRYIWYIWYIPLILLGILIYNSKPFQEGIKTAMQIGGILAAGVTMAAADIGRDKDEEEKEEKNENKKKKNKNKKMKKQRITTKGWW